MCVHAVCVCIFMNPSTCLVTVSITFDAQDDTSYCLMILLLTSMEAVHCACTHLAAGIKACLDTFVMVMMMIVSCSSVEAIVRHSMSTFVADCKPNN